MIYCFSRRQTVKYMIGNNHNPTGKAGVQLTNGISFQTTLLSLYSIFVATFRLMVFCKSHLMPRISLTNFQDQDNINP